MAIFNVRVIEVGTPILFSIDDVDRLGIYLNNLNDALVYLQLEFKAC